MDQDIRWKQRYQSFDRALALLREPVDGGIERLSDLEKEGTTQRFKVALELAWKTMKHYLEDGGLVLTPLTPKNVVKEAFASHLVEDGQVWVDMLDHRNLLSHTYDRAEFQRAVEALRDRYLRALTDLHTYLGATCNQS